MHEYRRLLGIGREAGVVARVLPVSPGHQQHTGVFVTFHHNALLLIVVDHLLVTVPEHIGRGLCCVVQDTHKAQDTAGFYVLLGSSKDFRLCLCTGKVKLSPHIIRKYYIEQLHIIRKYYIEQLHIIR